jgi:16S rRNA (adenine1518-N6/adenine1519-N6)-dimethyltransferase
MELNQALKKSLGQHLLKDKNLLKKMVRLAGINADDVVVEIGPGHGDLTRAIAPEAGSVYSIELDERFKSVLKEVEKDFPNVEVIFSDILKIDLADFGRDHRIVVMGNIPYNITGEILFKLLAARAFIRGAYLTMQREVADRLVSSSHTRTYGALSVIFQLSGKVRLLSVLRPGLFVPPPKVDSAFVSLTFAETDALNEGLINFIKTCFRHKRKFLRHSLEGSYGADEIDALYGHMVFSRSVRAEEIEPGGFVAMYHFLKGRENDT